MLKRFRTHGGSPPGSAPETTRIYPSPSVKRPPFATGAVVLLAVMLTGLIIYGVLNTGDDTSLDSAVKRGERPVAPAADRLAPGARRQPEDRRSRTCAARSSC